LTLPRLILVLLMLLRLLLLLVMKRWPLVALRLVGHLRVLRSLLRKVGLMLLALGMIRLLRLILVAKLLILTSGPGSRRHRVLAIAIWVALVAAAARAAHV